MDRYSLSTPGRPDVPWVPGSLKYQHAYNADFGNDFHQSDRWHGGPGLQPQNTFISEEGFQGRDDNWEYGDAAVDQKARSFQDAYSCAVELPMTSERPLFPRAATQFQSVPGGDFAAQASLNAVQLQGGYYHGAGERHTERNHSYGLDAYKTLLGMPEHRTPIIEPDDQFNYGATGGSLPFGTLLSSPGLCRPPQPPLQHYSPAHGELYAPMEPRGHGFYPEPPTDRFDQALYGVPVPSGAPATPGAGLPTAHPPRQLLPAPDPRHNLQTHSSSSTSGHHRKAAGPAIQQVPVQHGQKAGSPANQGNNSQVFKKVSHIRKHKQHLNPETMPDHVYTSFPKLVKRLNIRLPQPFGYYDQKTQKYEFTYDPDGQLHPGTAYTSEQLQRFIDHKVQEGKDPEGTPTFRIWIQTPPSQSTKRMKHSGVDSKCRLEGCPVTRRTINAGWIRAAFDDFSIYASSGQKDPLKVAGVVHLNCLEKRILTPKRMVELHDAGVLQPDDRYLEGETKNPIELERESGKGVLECFRAWFTEARRKATDRFWSSHDDTLSRALNKYHVDKQPVGRSIHRMKGKKKGDKPKTIEVHLGDLEEYIRLERDDREKKAKAKREAKAKEAKAKELELAERGSTENTPNTDSTRKTNSSRKRNSKAGSSVQGQDYEPPRRRDGKSAHGSEPRKKTEESRDCFYDDVLDLDQIPLYTGLFGEHESFPFSNYDGAALPGSPAICFVDTVDPNLQAVNNAVPAFALDPLLQTPKPNSRKRSSHDLSEGSSPNRKRTRISASHPTPVKAGLSDSDYFQTQPDIKSTGIKRQADEDLYESPAMKKMRQ